MLIAGLDEAGRGCVIGPMAIAGVLVDEDGLRGLIKAGVRDSKALSPKEREKLANEIKAVVLDYHVVLVQPSEIDRAVAVGGLNKLEAKVMAEIIDRLKPEVAYVDAGDVVEERFALLIRSFLKSARDIRIVSEHEADARYPVVAAASILAKVERDKAVREIESSLGLEIGSGYPSDPRTLRFLREWYTRNRSFPDFVRKSWRTAKEIASEIGKTTLDKWYGK